MKNKAIKNLLSGILAILLISNLLAAQTPKKEIVVKNRASVTEEFELTKMENNETFGSLTFNITHNNPEDIELISLQLSLSAPDGAYIFLFDRGLTRAEFRSLNIFRDLQNSLLQNPQLFHPFFTLSSYQGSLKRNKGLSNGVVWFNKTLAEPIDLEVHRGLLPTSGKVEIIFSAYYGSDEIIKGQLKPISFMLILPDPHANTQPKQLETTITERRIIPETPPQSAAKPSDERIKTLLSLNEEIKGIFYQVDKLRSGAAISSIELPDLSNHKAKIINLRNTFDNNYLSGSFADQKAADRIYAVFNDYYTATDDILKDLSMVTAIKDTVRTAHKVAPAKIDIKKAEREIPSLISIVHWVVLANALLLVVIVVMLLILLKAVRKGVDLQKSLIKMFTIEMNNNKETKIDN